MRNYATISPQFWLGDTGRKLRKSGPESMVVALYMMTSPHSNMLGLYYLPVLYIAHETGLDPEGASKGLQMACEAGFCSYDHDSEVVWVHEMAAWQVGESLKPGDNRCAGVRNEYSALLENPFLSSFYDRYKDDFHLDVRRESCRKIEAPSEPLSSQEQEQEQEQERDKTLLVHGEKIATDPQGNFCPVLTERPGPAGTTPEADSGRCVQQVLIVEPEQQRQPQQPEADSAMSGKPIGLTRAMPGPSAGRVDYPDVFERVWREYPHRAGSNPKKSAFNAWRARLREGVSPDVVLDGVRRYARYLEATGKAGTEFVQQASTFFGPNRNFENPWSLPKAGAVSLRCVNHISEPDTEIPPGFRG
ncbi:DNA-binding protein [Escherichia coli]|nr:DNA-binding protein [Escherichia coli]